MNYKSILLTTFGFTALISAILYTSCKKNDSISKDPCVNKVCQNGGTCRSTDGKCMCTYVYVGDNCEYKCATRDQFIGIYWCTDSRFPNDTVYISNDLTSGKLKVLIFQKGQRDSILCSEVDCGISGKDQRQQNSITVDRSLDGSLNVTTKDSLSLRFDDFFGTSSFGAFYGKRL